MDFLSFLNGFFAWSQTPLGIAIIAPLTVATVLGFAAAVRRFIRSIPARFDDWLRRRVGIM